MSLSHVVPLMQFDNVDLDLLSKLMFFQKLLRSCHCMELAKFSLEIHCSSNRHCLREYLKRARAELISLKI